MSRRKPHPTVSVGAKVSPEQAEKLYKVANNEFGGSISEAVRGGIRVVTSLDEISLCAKCAEEIRNVIFKG